MPMGVPVGSLGLWSDRWSRMWQHATFAGLSCPTLQGLTLHTTKVSLTSLAHYKRQSASVCLHKQELMLHVSSSSLVSFASLPTQAHYKRQSASCTLQTSVWHKSQSGTPTTKVSQLVHYKSQSTCALQKSVNLCSLEASCPTLQGRRLCV